MPKVVVGAVTAAAGWQAGTGNSAAVSIVHLTDVTVLLTGTFVGTVFVDVSDDGTTFAPWGSLTAPGAYTKLPYGRQFRMRTSAYTSGTPVATYGGLKP